MRKTYLVTYRGRIQGMDNPCAVETGPGTNFPDCQTAHATSQAFEKLCGVKVLQCWLMPAARSLPLWE